MSDQLNETAAEVAALIPKYSWEIMDEEQRDDLMARVVLPRYMAVTADGTKLGPSWWAAQIGGTARAFESRVYRIRQAESENDHAAQHSRALSDSRARHVKSGLEKAAAEQVKEIIQALPADAVERVAEAVEERVPKRDWTTKPAKPAPAKPISQRLHDAVWQLWLIQDELEDSIPGDEERVRMLGTVRNGHAFLEAVQKRLERGEIDNELAAFLAEVQA